jgi:hypothetical protein
MSRQEGVRNVSETELKSQQCSTAHSHPETYNLPETTHKVSMPRDRSLMDRSDSGTTSVELSRTYYWT